MARALKFYIAGPMTGYPDYNRAAFDAKAKELTEQPSHAAEWAYPG